MNQKDDLKNINPVGNEEGWHWFRRKGLGRTMLFWFLVLSVVPLMLVSIISYNNARKSLAKLSLEALVTTTDLSAEQIRFYFDRLLLDLKQESESKLNTWILSGLSSAHANSGLPAKDFVRSYPWAKFVDAYTSDLKTFCYTYGYKDVMLADHHGNILFTVAAKKDLGANLFAGPLSGTRLSAAARKAMESGRPVFSDYEHYGPMDNAICGFLASVLLDEQGERIGLVIFNISSRRTDEIMISNYVAGKAGHTYLVGPDAMLRSRCPAIETEDVLSRKIDSRQIEAFEESHAVEKMGETAHHIGVEIYRDPFGHMVFGVHRDLEIASVHWIVIAEEEVAQAFKEAHKLGLVMSAVLLGTIVLVIWFSVRLTRRTFRPLQSLSMATRRIAAGHLDQTIAIQSRNEIGELTDNLNQMVESLRAVNRKYEVENWFKNGRAELNDRIRLEEEISPLSNHVISFLCHYLDATVGAVYTVMQTETLQLTGRFALKADSGVPEQLHFGEGLAGQAAVDRSMVKIPGRQEECLAVQSGLGHAVPSTIVALPLVYEQQVEGVVEIGFPDDPDARKLDFLYQIAESIALAFRVAQNRKQMKELLEQTQAQARALGKQEETLLKNNALLEQQSRELRASEDRLLKQQVVLEEKNEALERQQAELSETNARLQKSAAELARQTTQLEGQKAEIEQKNNELENTQADLERKAEELALAGKYKSQFLANMSHELRTPLNSLLIFSKMLAENLENNLTDKQVEYIRIIYDSGNSLLNLINDILDLSKIEAGRMSVEAQPLELERFVHDVHQTFDILADEKGVEFKIDCAGVESRSIVTDVQKLHQIITNLLSNAFKFTGSGSVSLTIEPADSRITFQNSNLARGEVLCFRVCDSGTGIAPDKQALIFEAFQQEDGSTKRKYGGTGLGLSISRDLALLLGGEIQLKSEAGQGSCFSLYLPAKIDARESVSIATSSDQVQTLVDLEPVRRPDSTSASAESVPAGNKAPARPVGKIYAEDDRDAINPGDHTVLIIEDEPVSAQMVAKFARRNGFKCIVAPDGETGLELAEKYLPGGIMLDIGLPGIDGWEVMARLKENMVTRHIPVHFISASERNDDALTRKAVGYLTKPVNMQELKTAFGKIEHIIDKDQKDLLVVVEDSEQAETIKILLGEDDLFITVAGSGSEAFNLLAERKFDCVVVDSVLTDMTAQSFIEQLQVVNNNERIPVVVYTAKEIDAGERAMLAELADSILVKGAGTPERLLDETAFLLHRIESHLPGEKRQIIRKLHDSEAILAGKTILIVDDDMRNVYALSQMLQEKGVKVVAGANGRQGLEKLDAHPEIDLVLMDMLMPEMDGYEAIRQIRKDKARENLPIIAVTAKAMKGDRAECIQAGASDYLAKPLDPTRLLTTLRIWLYK